MKSHTIESESGHLRDGECPKCGNPIEWVRADGGSKHNADCRKCMVIWNARPSFVIFEVSSRPAKWSPFGAMVYADQGGMLMGDD